MNTIAKDLDNLSLSELKVVETLVNDRKHRLTWEKITDISVLQVGDCIYFEIPNQIETNSADSALFVRKITEKQDRILLCLDGADYHKTHDRCGFFLRQKGDAFRRIISKNALFPHSDEYQSQVIEFLFRRAKESFQDFE